ncbi:MAG: HzsA-related protein, partial [Planctomycetota bacterium]
HGKLAVIDPSRGRQETSGVTLVAPVKKLQGIIKIDRYGQDGDQWQYPYPLDEENYLVTFRPQAQKHFAIYFMNSKGERVLLASDPDISCNQPVPLLPRPLPPRATYPTNWTSKTGSYTIQDIYHGPGLKGIAWGTVSKIRVVALDFMATDIGRKHGPSTISDLAAWDVKIVLGEAPVYEDGSAAFEVPARTPVYFQAIDANGHVVQTMRSWSTLMPGEIFSCVGCHENKNESITNKPTSMALKAGIKPLEPFYDITGKGFSFPKMIQPILDAKCLKCHNGQHTKPPDLRSTPVWDEDARKFWNRSYHILISKDRPGPPANDTNQRLGIIAEKSRYLNWIGRWSVPVMIPPYSHGSSRSPLIWLLEKGHENVKMTQEEMDKISCWIDLALPHSGDWTEGMTPEDKEIYMKVYRKRLDWEKQEALNIQEYIKAQTLLVNRP